MPPTLPPTKPAPAPSAAVAAPKVSAPPTKPATLKLPPPGLSKPSPVSAHVPKTFSVTPWTDAGEGTKGLVYAASGMGKTTLASLAPDPIFIGLDDGGRKIRNAKTGQPVNAIPGVVTFDDLRDAVRQYDLFKPSSTCVIDTITRAEVLGEDYTLRTVKVDGKYPSTIEEYGYGKGYRFLTETMRLLLTDLDQLVKRGINVLLLAQEGQATIANLEGTDYLQDGPKLYTDKKGLGPRNECIEWCDHVIRIGHPTINVTKDNAKANKGKAHGSTERVIYTTKQLHFVAKSRPVNGNSIPPVVTFESPEDDSLWQFIFGGAVAEG